MASLGEGFLIGHWTNEHGGTGCTVVLPPANNVSSCDVRGSSASTRELELLRPEAKLTEVHAILLTGGSAFGLAAADGVMGWLAEREIGYRTATAVVPIVPAAVILDASVADPAARPGSDAGRAACDAAKADADTGLVGAGRGATVGKWSGYEHRAPGGFGIAEATSDGLRAAAAAVVNPVGDVIDADGSVIAGSSAPELGYRPPGRAAQTNTVLAVVAVKATLEKRDVRFLAARGSDGITVSVRPAHTRYDGDVVFAIAAPGKAPATPAELDVLGHLATQAVASAIRNAVTSQEVSNRLVR